MTHLCKRLCHHLLLNHFFCQYCSRWIGFCLPSKLLFRCSQRPIRATKSDRISSKISQLTFKPLKNLGWCPLKRETTLMDVCKWEIKLQAISFNSPIAIYSKSLFFGFAHNHIRDWNTLEWPIIWQYLTYRHRHIIAWNSAKLKPQNKLPNPTFLTSSHGRYNSTILHISIYIQIHYNIYRLLLVSYSASRSKQKSSRKRWKDGNRTRSHTHTIRLFWFAVVASTDTQTLTQVVHIDWITSALADRLCLVWFWCSTGSTHIS